MSATNPTVPINVTSRELRILRDLLGYARGPVSLREKLTAADEDMRLANRVRNREAKIARLAKRSPKEEQ